MAYTIRCFSWIKCDRNDVGLQHCFQEAINLVFLPTSLSFRSNCFLFISLSFSLFASSPLFLLFFALFPSWLPFLSVFLCPFPILPLRSFRSYCHYAFLLSNFWRRVQQYHPRENLRILHAGKFWSVEVTYRHDFSKLYGLPKRCIIFIIRQITYAVLLLWNSCHCRTTVTVLWNRVQNLSMGSTFSTC